MPQIKDIEKFNTLLLSIAKEEEILKKRGEALRKLPPLINPDPSALAQSPIIKSKEQLANFDPIFDTFNSPSSENEGTDGLDGLDNLGSSDLNESEEAFDTAEPEDFGDLDDLSDLNDTNKEQEGLLDNILSDLDLSASQAQEAPQDAEELSSLEDFSISDDQSSDLNTSFSLDDADYSSSSEDFSLGEENQKAEDSFSLDTDFSADSNSIPSSSDLDFGASSTNANTSDDFSLPDLEEPAFGDDTAFGDEQSFSDDTSFSSELPTTNEESFSIEDTNFSMDDTDTGTASPQGFPPLEESLTDDITPGVSNELNDIKDPFAFDASSDDAFSGFDPSFAFGGNKAEELSGAAIDDELNSLENGIDNAAGFNLKNSFSESLSFDGFEEPVAKKESILSNTNASANGSKTKNAKVQAKKGKAESVKQDDLFFSGEILLNEHEVDKIQDTLLSYPLNLRIAVEEIIAERPLDEKDIGHVIKLLLKGANAHEMARVAGKLIDKNISIPKGFEKKTGEDFEREQASFAYVFKHTILPVIRTSVLTLAGIAFLLLLINRFIYTPLVADSIYRAGYNDLEQDRFSEADELFVKAYALNPVKEWFYTYAEAYIKKGQYERARKKYFAIQYYYGFDKKGAMDWANFESSIVNYEEAIRVIKRYMLEKSQWDSDALLLLGDSYLSWGDDFKFKADYRDGSEKTADGTQAQKTFDTNQALEKWEDGRKTYARLITKYGLTDIYRGRITRTFIRKDIEKEVASNRDYFTNVKELKISALTAAEIGEYMLSKGRTENLKNLLIAGAKQNSEEPEIHYTLALYFKAVNEPSEELKSLRNAQKMFEYYETKNSLRLSGISLVHYIDVLNRHALALNKNAEYIEAEKRYKMAIERYEQALSIHTLKRDESGNFGIIYSNLADIDYFVNFDYERAYRNYTEAELNGFTDRDSEYKRGYIQYAYYQAEEAFRLNVSQVSGTFSKDQILNNSIQGDALKRSLSYFFKSASDFSESNSLLFALGNTFYLREDFGAAIAYYREGLDRLSSALYDLQILEPQVSPKQNEMVVEILKFSNNLAAATYKYGIRNADIKKRAEAMALLTESSRMFDSLTRDLQTMERGTEVNLAALNMTSVLYPAQETQVQTKLIKNTFNPTVERKIEIYRQINKERNPDLGKKGIQDTGKL